MLTITAADAACVIKRLPAVGTAAVLPSGNHLFGANCTNAIPITNQGKFNNVLLGQTITLGLNLRMNAPLGALNLSPQITTLAGTPGTDQLCGTTDDMPVAGSEIQKNIPQSVITALNSLYGSPTIAKLFDLANRALGGQTTGGASLAEINQAISAVNEGFDGCRFLKTTSSYIINSDLENADSQNQIAAQENRDLKQLPEKALSELYPNPFNESFTVVYTIETESKTELQVMDLFGKIVYKADLDPKSTSHEVNLSNMADGMYLVQLIVNGEAQDTKRVVKNQ